METGAPRILNAKDTMSLDNGRCRQIIRSAIAMLIVAILVVGACFELLSSPGEGHPEADGRADCYDENFREQMSATCKSYGLTVGDHAVLDRISKMFPTHGV